MVSFLAVKKSSCWVLYRSIHFGLNAGEIIGKFALDFLGGSSMDRILTVQVSKLLSEEDTNEQVAKEAKKGLFAQIQ